MTDTGDFASLAQDEIPAPATVAFKTMPTMPANSDTLPNLPRPGIGTDGVDCSGDLVPGNSRELQAGPQAILHQHIAVTDPACFDFNTNLTFAGLWDVAFHKFPVSARPAHLRRRILGTGRMKPWEKAIIVSMLIGLLVLVAYWGVVLQGLRHISGN